MALRIRKVTGQEDDKSPALIAEDPIAAQPPAARVNAQVPGLNDPEFAVPAAPATGRLKITKQNGRESVPAGTPDRNQYTAFGYDVDPSLDPVVQPAMDAAIGFNSMIAKLGGIALDDVDAIVRDIAGSGFLDMPGDGAKTITDALTKRGVAADRTKAISDFAANIGESTFTGMLTMGGLFAMAPRMAAASGESVSAILQRAIGGGLQQTPLTTTLASEAGGIVGGEVGRVATEGTPLEPIGTMVGGITGGILGSSRRAADALVEGAKGGARGTVAGGVGGALLSGGDPTIGATAGGAIGAAKGLARGASGGPAAARAAEKAIPKTAKPILDATADNIELVGEFAKEAVAGDIKRVENTVQNIVNTVRGGKNPGAAAERLRGGLMNAYKTAQTRADALWKRVDMKRPMDTKGINTLADEMLSQAGAVTRDVDVPGDIIKRIRQMAGRPDITMGDFNKLRGLVTTRLRDEAANLTDTERRGLTQIQGKLLSEMQNQYPTDQSLGAAREFSSWLHTQFDEGPVGAFLNRRAGGPDFDAQLGDISNPGRAADTMMRTPKSGKQISGIADRLSDPELMRQSEDMIRQRFQQEAADFGPEEANKLINRPEIKSFIKAFPKANAEMEDVSNGLQKAFDERNMIESSAFTKFASVDPQTAVSRVMANPNKVAAAKEITGRLEGDPEALEAFRYAIVTDLFKVAGNDPTRVAQRMASKDMRPMLENVFGDKFPRFDAAVTRAAKLASGGETYVGGATRKGLPILAKLIGLRGASAIHSKGPGSLATASLIGNAAQDAVAGMLGKIDPSTLLSKAMIDPQFERILWTREPGNLADAESVTRQIRSIVSTLAGANATWGPTGDGDDRPKGKR